MRIRISHLTEYAYDEPVEFSLQRLRLFARNAPGQIVHDWAVSVEGAAVEARYDDHFGNRVELVSPRSGATTITVKAEGTVTTTDLHGVFGPHQGHVPLWLFLRETPLTRAGKLVRDLARKVTGDGELARCHALMGLVHDQIAYKTGETGIETTAEQALERKSGVCQDHAHAFIAGARALGIPARYISGYLHNGDTHQVASHAWAEAHVTGLGWVGFDPANKICPGEAYVRLANGLDYTDAAPISGMRHGHATETMTISVTVEDLGQSQSQSQS